MEDYSIGTLFIIVGLLLGLSAFFSGSETALMAVNRYRLRTKAEQGHRGAMLAQKLLQRPDRLIGLILLGNNIVNILVAQLCGYIGYRLHGELGFAIATAVLIFVVLVFAELAPKTLAAIHSDKVAYPAAYIYSAVQYVGYPIVVLINFVANNTLRLCGVRLDADQGASLGREELKTAVNEAAGLISADHQTMLHSILDLEQITVEDIMIPRNEVLGIDLDDDWDEVCQQITRAPYTRMPIFREHIDNVIGFIHMRKVLPSAINNELTEQELLDTMREPYFIPEGTSLNEQLINFRRERRRIGLVVDEYGDIQGLVTLEDLLEEIVGEFTNNPTNLHVDIHPQEDGSFVVDGSTHVRDINKTLDWDLHENGPRTVNGLVLEQMETIPEPGTTVLIDGYPIEVVHTLRNAVRTVRMKPRIPSYNQPAA